MKLLIGLGFTLGIVPIFHYPGPRARFWFLASRSSFLVPGSFF